MEQINERVSTTSYRATPLIPIPYSLKTLNGELPPWRLRPRSIPQPESSPVAVSCIHACQSPVPPSDWFTLFDSSKPLILPAGTSHSLDIQADVHSTAFTKWIFSSEKGSEVKLRLTYSEDMNSIRDSIHGYAPRAIASTQRMVTFLDLTTRLPSNFLQANRSFMSLFGSGPSVSSESRLRWETSQPN